MGAAKVIGAMALGTMIGIVVLKNVGRFLPVTKSLPVVGLAFE